MHRSGPIRYPPSLSSTSSTHSQGIHAYRCYGAEQTHQIPRRASAGMNAPIFQSLIRQSVCAATQRSNLATSSPNLRIERLKIGRLQNTRPRVFGPYSPQHQVRVRSSPISPNESYSNATRHTQTSEFYGSIFWRLAGSIAAGELDPREGLRDQGSGAFSLNVHMPFSLATEPQTMRS